MLDENTMHNNTETANELPQLLMERREKLAHLRTQGNAYRNDFRRDQLAQHLHAEYAQQEADFLREKNISVKIAGRVMLRRLMGKASFLHIQDSSGRMQIYVRLEDIGETHYQDFKTWDIGDIIGVEGTLFKTKTGELSVHAQKILLLTKSLRPLPDKFHGLTDQELRYRQRYVDLIMNEKSRETFLIRSRLTQALREFLQQEGFLEVETPMMQVIPGGATARPFVTHHNALNMPMYLRVAPELYLKRLVVGGFEKVFEINRNFRNEGLSTRHNPEFTMLEFYQAYADYHDLMNLTEKLFKTLSEKVLGKTQLNYQGNTIDFAKPFTRLTLKESIIHFDPSISMAQLDSLTSAQQLAKKHDIKLDKETGLGKIQTELFEKIVEHQLLQPTFITEYPAEVSPLARRNDHNPFITDRFELFIGGREIANAFSELNDPEDQAERFREQVNKKDAGDQEAMHYDADYINALEYGMPPTAGEGVGIDRLVMLFTDSPTIRDVILFPHMRPEAH